MVPIVSRRRTCAATRAHLPYRVSWATTTHMFVETKGDRSRAERYKQVQPRYCYLSACRPCSLVELWAAAIGRVVLMSVLHVTLCEVHESYKHTELRTDS